MAKKQSPSHIYGIACERAIDELARQMGLVFQQDKHKLGVFPVEFLTPALLASWRKKKANSLSLLLTPARAASLGLKTKSSISVQLDGLDFDAIMALADPTHGVIRTWRGLKARSKNAGTLAPLLTLAKHASLLPALLVISGTAPKEWMALSTTALTHYLRYPKVEALQTAAAKLPIRGAEKTRVVSFRTQGSNATHLALLIGDAATAKHPLVRVHSSCVTGDMLGSLRCDCGDQLQMALKAIIAEKAGLLIYLHQEGRGIGITNKLRAYTLQERGFDTYDANRMLGFAEDERDFSIVGALLKQLGIHSIRLLTNNPGKIDALKKHGIKINARVPLVAKGSKHNQAYLLAKSRAGHQF